MFGYVEIRWSLEYHLLKLSSAQSRQQSILTGINHAEKNFEPRKNFPGQVSGDVSSKTVLHRCHLQIIATSRGKRCNLMLMHNPFTQTYS
jgi:hypothetical protein